MNMEHRWNNSNKQKPKYTEKNLSQCHFFSHKYNMDWPLLKDRVEQIP